MPIVLKSGSFNLLEPSAPVQACNGIALPYMGSFEYIDQNFMQYFRLYIDAAVPQNVILYTVEEIVLKSRE